MAVQAQYPSNVLLLNRTGQEGLDYLQPQPGGIGGGGGGSFLDQSYMLFNNGGSSNINNNNNQRKRGREVTAPNTTTTSTTTPINTFSVQNQIQNQTPQLISLSQLHNHQQHPNVNVVSTGLRLSFGDQQQQQLQQTHHHHHHHQQQQHHIICQSPSLLSLISEDFATQIKHQRDELDQFLHAQGEQLRRTLAEKRQRHYRALLGAAEESLSRRLREREAEVEKATRRNVELEARAAQLSVEAHVWQAKARAQEATAASLQAQLQQAIMTGTVAAAADSRRGEEGLMCTGEAAEDAESAYVDPERVVSVSVSGPSCKGCRKRVASVVLLPCRHLSVCTECDRVVQACPLCFKLRESSVEVFLS